MTTATLYDTTPCTLGEGPLWHPLRQQLFWFDISSRKLYARDGATLLHWDFPEIVSAAGWIDADTLLIASQTALFRFTIASGARETIVGLEADNQATRPNDGRADAQGGFWIGTMGNGEEPGQGAIHRYYRGEVRALITGITVPNAICFTHDGKHAHYCDSGSHMVMRTALDRHGWPTGTPEVFLDLTAEKLIPDGAVVDAAGTLWLAQWGAARVAAYDPQGRFVRAVSVDAPHASCPAFGGPNLTTLFCTTAREGLSPDTLAANPNSGKTFAAANIARGMPEYRVIL